MCSLTALLHDDDDDNDDYTSMLPTDKRREICGAMSIGVTAVARREKVGYGHEIDYIAKSIHTPKIRVTTVAPFDHRQLRSELRANTCVNDTGHIGTYDCLSLDNTASKYF